MRPIKIYLVSILLFFVACNETYVTNFIHEDGSIDREVINKDDSFNYNFIVPVDSTWSVETKTEFDSLKQDTIKYVIAKKHYKTCKELNDDYQNGSSNFIGEREAAFHSEFNWFYSKYYFSEKIKALTTAVQLEEYFDSKEIQYIYYSEEEEDSLIKKDSLQYKAFFDSLSLKREKWSKVCYKEIIKQDIRNALLDEFHLDSNSVENICVQFDNINFDIESNDLDLSRIIPDSFQINSDSLQNIIKHGKINAILNEEFTMTFGMPGNIISTSGIMDISGMVKWEKISVVYYLGSDFTMEASSVKANYWTWWISGLFILLLIIYGIRMKTGRRS